MWPSDVLHHRWEHRGVWASGPPTSRRLQAGSVAQLELKIRPQFNETLSRIRTNRQRRTARAASPHLSASLGLTDSFLRGNLKDSRCAQLLTSRAVGIFYRKKQPKKKVLGEEFPHVLLASVRRQQVLADSRDVLSSSWLIEHIWNVYIRVACSCWYTHWQQTGVSKVCRGLHSNKLVIETLTFIKKKSLKFAKKICYTPKKCFFQMYQRKGNVMETFIGFTFR